MNKLATCFVVRVEFITPPIFTRRHNFDALLAHLLYEQNRINGMDHQDAVEHAHSNVPVAQEFGVYASSVALIPQCDAQPISYIQSVNRHLNEMDDPRKFIKHRQRLRINSPEYDRPSAPILNRYELSLVDKDSLGIWYLARGDIDEVRRLLADVHYLGKKQHGKIKGSIQVTEVTGYDHFGIMSKSGRVLRPVPKPMSHVDVPFTSYVEAYESYQIPYWDSSKDLCYVPEYDRWPYEVIMNIVEGME